jgi:hypothetical protein
MNRREHLKGLGTLLAAASLAPGSGHASGSATLPAAADRSRLIYISPLRADASESRCQAEVWFMREGDGLFVVTQADAWRARAIAVGRDMARIWVGDVGVWSRNPEYRDLPSVLARASMVTDPALQAAMLEKFGGKYADEWPAWGPRWQKGLADGSRVMIRYQLA